MHDDFSQAIREAIWCEIAGKLHTCMPAIVDKYDKDGPKVTVKPMIRRLMVDGQAKALPMMVEVPVVFPRTQDCHISFPLSRGDGVLLVFAERSLETWLKSGAESTPVDGRKFHLSDAIAIPGLFGFGKGHAIEDASKLEVVFKNAKLVSDGEGFEITGDVAVDGKITATGDVKAGAVSLNSHTHMLTIAVTPSPTSPYTGPTGGPQ